VSQITLRRAAARLTVGMLIAAFVTFIILLALGISQRSTRRNGLIAEHRYNNLYNDASAARQDHLS
jgi:hypothetical protein